MNSAGSHAVPLPEPGAPLLFLPPPYGSGRTGRKLPESIAEGSVAVLEVGDRFTDLQRVAAHVRRLRRAHPGLVIGGTWAGTVHDEHPVTVRLLAAAGLRLWVTGEPEGAALRASALASGFSPPDLEVWLEAYLRPRGVVEIGVVKALAGVAAQEEADRQSLRELRRWVRRLGLPTVRAWTTAGKLIFGLVSLQATAAETVESVASRHGFAHASSFSHACSRVFGLSPSVARQSIGWEWLLCRFLERSAR